LGVNPLPWLPVVHLLFSIYYIQVMSRDRLAFYPYILLRVACSHCVRRGSYRLARLGAKYGPDIVLDDLLRQLAGDCPHWTWSARWPEGCGAYFPDLVPPLRPPDLPERALRVIRGG
jgi:hypothetical protein